jgi:Protein of unknown function (DUF3383)
MSDLDQMIKINIVEVAAGVSAEGFGIGLLLASDLNSVNRVESYTADDDYAADFGVGSLAKVALAACFAQNPAPSIVKVGNVQGTRKLTASGTSGTWTAGSAKVTVNGKLATQGFATDTPTSLSDLATAIQAAASDYLTSTVYNAGVITLTPKAGVLLDIVVDLSGITGSLTLALTGQRTEDLDTALAAIRLVDDEWTYIAEDERTVAQVEKVAAAASGLDKVHLYASADPNIIGETVGADTTSLAAVFRGLAYGNTAGITKADAATKFTDAALMAWLSANNAPGSYTACFKTLLGETPEVLTTTQMINSIGSPVDGLTGKNINSYQMISGRPMLRYGVCADGGFLDEVIFKIWLKMQLQSAIATLFVQTPKVQGDINGATMIKNCMIPVFKQAQVNNAIGAYGTDNDPTSATYKQQNSGYYIILPDMSIRSAADKSVRNLSGVKFGCWYTGAIHTVQVTGMLI